MMAEARMLISLAAVHDWPPLMLFSSATANVPPSYHYRNSAAKRAKLRRRLSR